MTSKHKASDFTPSSHAGVLGGKPGPESTASPKSWWQWVLAYPALAIAVGGSIPTAYQLYLSVSTGESFQRAWSAKEQEDIWSKNLRCMEAPFEGLVNEYNVQVDATICKSGDVLVRFLGPQGRRSYRWVPVDKFEQRTALFFMGAAVAQPQAQQQNEVLVCQWAPGPGWVIRRVRNQANSVCINEKIRTATGQVVDRWPVACDAPCEGQGR